ncbi:hypothetical protein BDZ90DRAFT_257208 [Jaminaea rosea]|uniref:C2H2-type domain-containing protein n=1 Tax=Jaminaea rosea TaxID=1569628 RepID=A0A316V0N3_9BASI|nr:hypothetical protein BDZ90DRAFT_257208 [Jaminaea rosea]PWN30111.1 hypothetical protein BDZ90DRAFT_257208 [Jaminaea rosea]
MARTRSAKAAVAGGSTTASMAVASAQSPTDSDVKSNLLKASSLQDSFFEAPNSTSPTSSASFTFDLRVSEFPGTPGESTNSGNSDANPFFHRFEEDTAATSPGDDGQQLSSLLLPAFETDWDATLRQRQRTFTRISFSSSAASSTTSTAASENGDESADVDWETNNFTAMRQQQQVNGAADNGLSEAFEQHHLAGPCSFQDHQYDPSHYVHNEQQQRDAANSINPTGDHRPIPSFNLEDFISDAAEQPQGSEPTSSEDQQRNIASWQADPAFGSMSNADMLAALQGSINEHKRRETSESTGTAFSGSSAGSPPSPKTPGSPGDNAYGDSQSSHQSSPYVTPARCSPYNTVSRSMSFNGHASSPIYAQQQQHQHQQQHQQHFQSPQQLFVNGQGVVAASPVQHPALLRVGGGALPQTPVRSQSTSNLPSMFDASLSCNPAYITPGDVAAATPLEVQHQQGYFQGGGHRSDFPDSPVSSAFSSPLQWTAVLPNDDGAGEDTYRASAYGGGAGGPSAVGMSTSLPSRSALLSAGSAMGSMPSSPLSLAGQPMRPGRPSLHTSPYSVPIPMAEDPSSRLAPPSVSGHHHHLLPPNHPLSHLHNPYSNVITKRSRGRRVPITPEEMTNVGKSGKVYTCKVPGCGKLFKRSEHLKRHIRSIHTDEKPFTCQICHKKFSRHDNLNQHMRVHGPAAVAALAAQTAAAGQDGGGDYGSSSSSFGDDSSPGASPLSSASHRGVRRHSFLSQGSPSHYDEMEAQGENKGTIKGRRQTNASAPTLDTEVFDFDDGSAVEDGDVQLFSL